MQKIMLLLGLLWWGGCSSLSNQYYVLSMVQSPLKTYSKPVGSIGVEKITVPGYLYKRQIAIAKSDNQIELLQNAVWGEDLDSGLTERLIGYLQKKFDEPHVYAYPWGLQQTPKWKVKMHISRFIAKEGSVYLDANWQLFRGGTKEPIARLFSITIPTSSDPSQIVIAMDQAFRACEEEIARGIRES